MDSRTNRAHGSAAEIITIFDGLLENYGLRNAPLAQSGLHNCQYYSGNATLCMSILDHRLWIWQQNPISSFEYHGVHRGLSQDYTIVSITGGMYFACWTSTADVGFGG